ncbi:MAG: DegT/DnrJ/EryC1/StrS family aminotransferase [Nitrososphaerota archaeon]
MINVTKSFLPPIERYIEYLKGIWERGHLTNHGPLVLELEAKLKEYLEVPYIFFVSNGTIALQIAIKALELKGDIITTPFSYVATTSSIVWEHCCPVFVDIESDTLTIDPKSVENAITDKTTAILCTHVYGNPCDVEAIQLVARKYNLKVIYDAAHSFGVRYKGKSLLSYGDFSTLSFHATKIFHTVEGGAIVTENAELAHRASYMRNFGHNGPEDFYGVGINGKNSELHAAMGLCLLEEIDEIILRRQMISETYDELLKGLNIERPKIREHTKYNYAYYPVIFPSEEILLKVKASLNDNQIYPRRYFYPSLNKLNYVVRKSMPISEDIARRVLCLPLYPQLDYEDVAKICGIISRTLELVNA